MTWLGSLLESRARKEGPYSLSDAGVTTFLGLDTVSGSGVEVNESTALNCTAVFACVRAISEPIASMPLVLYKRDGEGRDRDEGHSLFPLLRHAPNDDMTSVLWRETAVAHVLLWGNSYSWIRRDGSGRVRSIQPLHPGNVSVERARAGGELVYRYEGQAEEGIPKILRSFEVLHVPGLSMNGIRGMSVIQANRDSIGLAMAATRYGASFFGNGARPGGIIKSDKILSPEAKRKIKESWEASHQGPDKWLRVGMLDGNLQWQDVGINPEDAQFLEQRQFQTEEIARMFRVPLVLLQSPTQGAVYGAGIEQLMLGFVTYTLQPYLVRFEQEMYRKLLSEDEKRTHFVEHMTDSLLRGDFKTRMDGYVQGKSWGFLSTNDVRRRENLPPILESWGDEFIIPANYVPAADAGKVTNAPAPAPVSDSGAGQSGAKPKSTIKSARDLFEPLLTRTLAEVVEREIGAVRKGFESRDVDEFLPWVEDYYRGTYGRVLADRLDPVLEAVERASDSVATLARGDEMAAASLAEIQAAIHSSIHRQLSSKDAVLALLSEWAGSKVRRLVDSVFLQEVGYERAA